MAMAIHKKKNRKAENMKKRIFAIALVVCFLATAIVSGTLAYLTDEDKAENVFTVGKVEIDLTEPNWDATGKEEAKESYPGERLAKDPTVENIGPNPCFVRIKIENLDQFGNKGAITYRTDYVDGKLGENWEEYNGYFYYTKPLVVKGTENDSWNAGLVSKTDALFDQIVMPTGLTGAEEAKPIIVYAEAVQAQGAKEPNWAAVKGMTVEEIAAWFTTCGM